MKREYLLFYISFFLIISCKKEAVKNYENMSSTEHFSIPTSLKNIKNIEKFKINDSLYKIKGKFNSYEIKGYIKNINKRISWWEANEYKSKKPVARLEYKLIDNKEFVNQYILFENGKLDTLNSKFYSINKNINLIKYKFYTPYSSKKLQSEGKLNYHIYSNGKENVHLQCKCIKSNNIFDCEFSIPANIDINNFTIRGNFWELFQLENGDIGENEIYVLDTIK